MMTRNIYLTGFMGCGKSTVGRHLAARLKREFIDTDERIAELAGMDAAKIFRSLGEEYFRNAETRVLREISRRHGIVLVLGGGAVMRAENRAILKHGAWVFLDTPFALIEPRVLDDPSRPLAMIDSEELRALWLKRRRIYLEAPIVVCCLNFTPDAVSRLVQWKLERL